jgi:hypothetical protein
MTFVLVNWWCDGWIICMRNMSCAFALSRKCDRFGDGTIGAQVYMIGQRMMRRRI